MKSNKLGILITNKKGDVYQVALTTEEMNLFFNVLGHLHHGKIKVLDKKLENITLGKVDSK